MAEDKKEQSSEEYMKRKLWDDKFKKAKPEKLKTMMSCGGKVHKMKSGGKPGDGCCIKGKTRGRMC